MAHAATSCTSAGPETLIYPVPALTVDQRSRPCGDSRRAIRALPAAQRLILHFVDLGESYARGFARSLLGASALLGSPDENFLLCTPDHIFDASLIDELRNTPCRADLEAIALVEDNVRSVSGALPPTAVHVRVTTLAPPSWPHMRVIELGKQVPDAMCIEAGLYRCNGAFFTILASLSASQSYFTVAEAMQTMIARGRLGAMMTRGRRWLALETRDQMETVVGTAVGSDGRSVHFPWQVRIARADPLGSVHGGRSVGRDVATQASRLVLPLSELSPAEPTTFTPSSSHPQLDFLLISSAQTSLPGTTPVVPPSSYHLAEPLLPMHGTVLTPGLSGLVDSVVVRSSIGSAGTDLPALSIEWPSYDAVPGISPRRHGPPCFLIELPPSRAGAPTERWLALPAPTDDAEPMSPPRLPPAIDRVALTVTADDVVVLTVHKRVPLAGWLLLIMALVTCYSGAPVTDLQSNALPTSGTTFLRSSWRGMCSAVASGLFACTYPVSRSDLHTALQLQLSRSATRRILAAGLGFFVNFAAFNIALEHTSISHAALFESCSALHIVLGRAGAACLGLSGRVPRAHLFGVLLGGLGAGLTTQDAAQAPLNGTGGPAVSTYGDSIALCSGLGAAIYLTLAEGLRVDIDSLAFFTLVMGQFGLLCLAMAFIMDEAPPSFLHPLDPVHGVLGWLDATPARLLAQLWLAIVVDLLGNFGFIAAMAYVPALTISAVMLLGPLTSCVEGIAVGVDQLPGTYTLLGGVLITAGSGMISFATSERTATVEIASGRAPP